MITRSLQLLLLSSSLGFLAQTTSAWTFLTTTHQQQHNERTFCSARHSQYSPLERTNAWTVSLYASSSSSDHEFSNDEHSLAPKEQQRLQPTSQTNVTEASTTINANNETNSKKVHDLHKKMRLQQAQADMDRILASPDAPVDLEQELKKVILIAPPQPQSSVDDSLEQHESQLEQDLYLAAKQRDFDAAAKLQKEISQLHIDDCGSVLYVNAQFYKAFSNQDYSHMATLWTKDGTATCIHPACRALIGTKAILSSWQTLFINPTNQRTMIEPHQMRLAVKGATTAILTCEEHVYTRRFVQGQKRQTELVNKLLATNIFRKVNGKWLLHHHHASWHCDSKASKTGLRHMNSHVSGGGKSSRRNSQDSKQDLETADANIMNGILGSLNVGPLLNSSGAGKKPAKRIVAMGSLSDLLNGSLGGFLGGSGEDDDDDDDDEEDEGDGNNKSLRNIIRITSETDDDDDDDVHDELHLLDGDDDSDDEDGDDDEYEVVDIEPEERVSLKRWNKSKSMKTKSKKEDVSNNMVTGAPKDALRQACIAALRKLSEQGAISPKQKRVLLTDIISCSKKGDFSMVEVAYELLCGESEDKDVAEEEFADQCRVLAQSLPDPLAPSMKND
ncbi:hypothetical protein MPSEU_000308600 [Mayamaea pseudoterrestris]|nr:hypothetical protein MPSEU_000308600 [Mayamaea pseudoterrestris]